LRLPWLRRTWLPWMPWLWWSRLRLRCWLGRLLRILGFVPLVLSEVICLA